VVDNLEPNLLLGNDFLLPYQADIDYGDNKVRFSELQFAVNFQARTQAVPCVRKVKTTRKITLLPHQEALVPVEYKPLPSDRPFMFNSYYTAALNAVVNAKTPKVVAVKNPSEGIMTIDKRFPIGKIEDSIDSGFFASSWSTAFAALTVATALATAAQPTVTTDVDPTSLMGTLATVPLVGGEFVLDDPTRSVAT